jgi:hypothetical protein
MTLIMTSQMRPSILSAFRHRRVARSCLSGVLAFAFACRSSDYVAPITDAASLTADVRGQVLLVNGIRSSPWADDPLTIVSATVEGDSLLLIVTYGGGCTRHALQLISETAWMESYPVQVRARVAHNAGGDPCEALIRRVLHIDLTPLKHEYQRSYQTLSGRIVLRLEGYTGTVEYGF